MPKIEMTMPSVSFDVSGIAEARLVEVMRKAMHERMLAHSRKYLARKQPDGSAQKKNSEPYRTRKAGPGIKVGSRHVRGEVPTYLTGEMHASRSVVTEHSQVTARFSGKNADKARGLRDKGYGIHYFSPEDIKAVSDLVAKYVSELQIIKIGK